MVRNLARKYIMREKVKSQNQTNINIDICVDIRTIISILTYSIMGRASFSNATKDFAYFIKTYRKSHFQTLNVQHFCKLEPFNLSHKYISKYINYQYISRVKNTVSIYQDSYHKCVSSILIYWFLGGDSLLMLGSFCS